jgi:hypothetical protein
MLDNLQACPGHVISHDRIGALRVGSDDRLNHLVMFVESMFGLAEHELKYSKRRTPLPKAPRDRCDACVVRAVVDDSWNSLFSAAKSPVPSKILSSRLRFTTSGRCFSSMVTRTAPSFAQSASNSASASNMSCSCSTSIRATVTRFRGVTSTRPVPLILRSASRIGVRETPNFRRMLGSSRRAPGSVVPDKMSFTSAPKISSESVTVEHRSGG